MIKFYFHTVSKGRGYETQITNLLKQDKIKTGIMFEKPQSKLKPNGFWKPG